MRSAEQALLTADDERITAATNSDAAALDRIYTDDFQLILQNGSVRGKHEQVDDYRSGALQYVSHELVERRVRILGDVAIIWSRERSVILYHGSQNVGGDRRVTRVWVLRDGRWCLLAAHASAVA